MSFTGATVARTVEPYFPIESRKVTLSRFQRVIEGLQSDCSFPLSFNLIHYLFSIKNSNVNLEVVFNP